MKSEVRAQSNTVGRLRFFFGGGDAREHPGGEPNGNSSSREAVQMPAPATSKWGLGREAQAALLRVTTRPECPKVWDRTKSDMTEAP